MLDVGAGADDAVDLGNQALQLLAVALRETTGDDQMLTAPLARGVFENHLGRFGLRRIDERARIDDDRVRAARASGSRPSPRRRSLAIITSVSTRFFAQPKLTNATLRIEPRSSTGS